LVKQTHIILAIAILNIEWIIDYMEWRGSISCYWLPSFCLLCVLQVLGTPTREEIKCMNPNYTEFKFPQIKAHPWHKVSKHIISFSLTLISIYSYDWKICCWFLKIFHKRTPPEAVDLVSRLLQYSPNLRSTAVSQW